MQIKIDTKDIQVNDLSEYKLGDSIYLQIGTDCKYCQVSVWFPNKENQAKINLYKPDQLIGGHNTTLNIQFDKKPVSASQMMDVGRGCVAVLFHFDEPEFVQDHSF